VSATAAGSGVGPDGQPIPGTPAAGVPSGPPTPVVQPVVVIPLRPAPAITGGGVHGAVAVRPATAAPGAAGNVGTEELVYLFGRSGVDAGISLADAVDANAWFATIMGRALPSRVGKAGDFAVKGDIVQGYSA
jgi:hypothetical protein